VIGVDCGFGTMTSVTVWMNYKDGVKVMLENKTYSQTPSGEIIKDVIFLVKMYRKEIIYADLVGKFENVDLQIAVGNSNELKEIRHSASVIEAVFSTDQEKGLRIYAPTLNAVRSGSQPDSEKPSGN
jgi:hypothetical protein